MPTDDLAGSPRPSQAGQVSLEEIAAVVEGTFSVETDDDQVGLAAFSGFQYFLHAELVKRYPDLSAVYGFEIECLEVTAGSRNYFFRAKLRLKKRVLEALRRAGPIGVAALIAAIPSCTKDLGDIVKEVATPAAASVTASCPSIQVNVVNITVVSAKSQVPRTPRAPKTIKPGPNVGKKVW